MMRIHILRRNWGLTPFFNPHFLTLAGFHRHVALDLPDSVIIEEYD